jgi:hypothetical protein
MERCPPADARSLSVGVGLGEGNIVNEAWVYRCPAEHGLDDGCSEVLDRDIAQAAAERAHRRA